MSELVFTRIRSTAGKLGLPRLAETLAQYAQRADEAKPGYLDFIDLVLSEELAVREDRRFCTGLRTSKLPHHKALEDYDFSFQPDRLPHKGRRVFVRLRSPEGSALLSMARAEAAAFIEATASLVTGPEAAEFTDRIRPWHNDLAELTCPGPVE
nr:ATP-binding protein [Streptomyces monomycini]